MGCRNVLCNHRRNYPKLLADHSPKHHLRGIVTNLARYKSDWEGLAERDALWAILTDESKAGGKWDLAEFMATGEAEIHAVMNHLAAIGHTPDRNAAALDFGCGVGRLTQALARDRKST